MGFDVPLAEVRAGLGLAIGQAIAALPGDPSRPAELADKLAELLSEQKAHRRRPGNERVVTFLATIWQNARCNPGYLIPPSYFAEAARELAPPDMGEQTATSRRMVTQAAGFLQRHTSLIRFREVLDQASDEDLRQIALLLAGLREHLTVPALDHSHNDWEEVLFWLWAALAPTAALVLLSLRLSPRDRQLWEATESHLLTAQTLTSVIDGDAFRHLLG